MSLMRNTANPFCLLAEEGTTDSSWESALQQLLLAQKNQQANQYRLSDAAAGIAMATFVHSQLANLDEENKTSSDAMAFSLLNEPSRTPLQ